MPFLILKKTFVILGFLLLADPAVYLIKETDRISYFRTLSVSQTSAVSRHDPLHPEPHKLERLASQQYL